MNNLQLRPPSRASSFLFLALLALAAGGCTAYADDAPASAEQAAAPAVVDGTTARALVADGARLVDVRTPEEFASGHIDGAVNIPYDQIPSRLSELEPSDAPVVVYCRSGRRSAIAATELTASGFEAVYDLGPMSAW